MFLARLYVVVLCTLWTPLTYGAGLGLPTIVFTPEKLLLSAAAILFLVAFLVRAKSTTKRRGFSLLSSGFVALMCYILASRGDMGFPEAAWYGAAAILSVLGMVFSFTGKVWWFRMLAVAFLMCAVFIILYT